MKYATSLSHCPPEYRIPWISTTDLWRSQRSIIHNSVCSSPLVLLRAMEEDDRSFSLLLGSYGNVIDSFIFFSRKIWESWLFLGTFLLLLNQLLLLTIVGSDYFWLWQQRIGASGIIMLNNLHHFRKWGAILCSILDFPAEQFILWN